MTAEPAVILCVGPEPWLRARAVEQLRKRILAVGFEETDFVRLSPDQTEAVLEAVSTAPLSAGGGPASTAGGGSACRLVVVEPWRELGPAAAPWLTAYLDRPNPRACLVLCADQFEGNRDRLPSVWNRPGRVQVVSCQSPEPRRWVLEQVRELGKSLQPEAAELLVSRVGTALSSLALALEQLCLLVGPAGEITPADVQALIPPSLRETAFEILDWGGAGQTARAIEALHQGLQRGRIPVDQFLGGFGWYVRMIWEARQGRSSRLRRQAVARLARWSDSQIRQLLEDTLEADLYLKLGHPAPELLADQLLIRL